MPNQDLIAGTYDWSDPKGIYRSTDGGANWSSINHGLTDLNINTIALDQNGQLFVLTGNDGLFISYDGGDTWNQLIDGNYYGIAFNTAGHIFISGYNNIGFGIFRSLDNGQTWHDYSAGLVPRLARSILVDQEDNIYAGLWGYGVFKGVAPTTIKNPLL